MDAPKISETRERPPKLVGFWIREARRMMSLSSSFGMAAGWVGLDEGDLVVLMVVMAAEVPDLVCSGARIVAEPLVTIRSTVRVYSTVEGTEQVSS